MANIRRLLSAAVSPFVNRVQLPSSAGVATVAAEIIGDVLLL
jgi:hypothetical protein